MPENSSSTGGFLQNTLGLPSNSPGVSDYLQQAIVGITGLDPTLVRPRWQSQPPTQPTVSTNWCAFGIESYDLYDYPIIIHNSSGLGSDDLYRLERINLLTSFYGPRAIGYAGLLRDGFYVEQNYAILSAQGVKLRSAENIVYVTELINSQYVNRADLFINFERMVHRNYLIENLVGAEVDISVDFPPPDGSTSTLIVSQES